jgi:hypothetical protein
MSQDVEEKTVHLTWKGILYFFRHFPRSLQSPISRSSSLPRPSLPKSPLPVKSPPAPKPLGNTAPLPPLKATIARAITRAAALTQTTHTKDRSR